MFVAQAFFRCNVLVGFSQEGNCTCSRFSFYPNHGGYIKASREPIVMDKRVKWAPT
jgi:hypothetical protein